MSEPIRARWPHLLLALGLLLAAVLFLLLVSGAFARLGQSPLSALPPPQTPTATRMPPPRATVEGLEERSGPTVNPQERQEGRSQ